jgi:hypothetical protein
LNAVIVFGIIFLIVVNIFVTLRKTTKIC